MIILMEQGLPASSIPSLQQQFGKNILSAKESFSVVRLLLTQLFSLVNIVLGIAGIFALVINQTVDAIFIFTIIILDVFLGFIQEYRAQKALEKLKSFSRPKAIVTRDGKAQEIFIEDLVPGDIVLLNEGDLLPADGRIISDSHLEVDESILTGESLPVIKKKDDICFRATTISKGKGRLLVDYIGDKTRIGQIAKTLTSITQEKTPLQKQILRLVRLFSFGALIVSFLLIPIGIFDKRSFYPLILIAVSIAVAAIPESLPAVITIALSVGTNRMAQKKAIVKKLSSIETVGAVQVILTDKTGTLTIGDMRVKEIFVPNMKLFHQFIHACIVGNTAHIVEEKDKKTIIGDKTDGALLLWAQEQKVSQSELEENKQLIILDEYTFDPQTKTITTVASLHDKPYVIVRGAPESILHMTNLSQKQKTDIQEHFQEFAKQGLRVIALAQKIEKNHKSLSRKELEKNLEFLGFLCLYDPPRDYVKEAVAQAFHAGIKVVMVTGDNPLTAEAIARDVGILDGEKTVLTGKDIDTMTDQQLKETIQHVTVFARTTPEHKLRLVTICQQLGFIVGVTGDGVNDALALKKAQVGIAMGQKGTDVAKEASDIVLADDNFSTFMQAVSEGRKIYANIVNAITYLITGNLAELLIIFFASILKMATPLLPTHILWINLVTDGLPALALANDKGGKYLLEKTPRKTTQPIITKERLWFIIIGSLVLTFIVLFAFSFIDDHFSLMKARTIAFGLVVILEMLLAVAIRGKNIFSNKFFYVSILVTIILQIIITIVPFFQNIFHLSI